ncbi:MAG: diguanylate cyclase [Fimbriiglobus sp.]
MDRMPNPSDVVRNDAMLRIRILDTPPESDFDDIARLASMICEAPISTISFLDGKRLWFKARVGLDVCEISKDVGFSAKTISTGRYLEIEDTFAEHEENLFVTEMGLRFYAGAPISTTDGVVIGSLSVSDRVPRKLTAVQRETLRILARQVTVLCAVRQKLALPPDSSVSIFSMPLGIPDIGPKTEPFGQIVENFSDGFFLVEHSSGQICQTNPSFAKMLGYTVEEILRMQPQDFHVDEAPDAVAVATANYKDDGLCDLGRRKYRKRDGSTIDVSVKVAFIPDGKEGLSGVIVQDVTAQRRYEDEILSYQMALEKANARLRALATTDGLTGARNRAAFNERLNHEYELSTRYKRALSLVLLDVDHFKSFNDSFGHPAGDLVLQTITTLLTNTARTTDTVARYGGEEFAIILPETDFEGAMVLAERCRSAVENHDWEQRPITISLGVSTLTTAMVFPGAMIQDADEALYLAKHFGRNRVHHGHESTRPADETPELLPLDFDKFRQTEAAT